MIKQALMKEIEHEGVQTKKVLERIPFDHFDWQPHPKSRPIGKLAIHVAEVPRWTSRAVTLPEFDIAATPIQLPEVADADQLVRLSNRNIENALADLEKATDEELMTLWTFRRGPSIVFTLPRAAVIRAMAMNHLVHHRGQLTVYLRLLNIPVPGLYGPSADES